MCSDCINHYRFNNQPNEGGAYDNLVGMRILRAALQLEAGPLPLEADCMKFQPFWVGGRPHLHIIIIL